MEKENKNTLIRFFEIEWMNLTAVFRKAPILEKSEKSFSFFAKSIYPQFFTGIILILFFDFMLVHLLIIPQWFSEYGAKAQLVTLLLEVYGILWLVGDCLNLNRSCHQLTEEGLELRLGMRLRAFVPYENIRAVITPQSADFSKFISDATLIRCSKRDIPQVCIQLFDSVLIQKSLGRDVVSSSIALFLDEPEKLVRLLSLNHESGVGKK